MPLPQEIQEELERKRREEHLQAERDSFRAHVLTALMCVAWSILGLAFMGWGLHTDDPDLGQIAWKGGMVVGYAGILVTLIRAHSKAKDRGDA
jgi:ABC-type amino acid transport system permease subunit